MARPARLRTLRVSSQVVFTALFVGLLMGAGWVGAQTVASSRFFFAIDPLLALTESLTTRTVAAGTLLALVPLALALLLGRFFCGWVCPLGAISHLVSWLATKLEQRPRSVGRGWAQVKYLVLAAVVVAAAGGSRVGSLIDPIALLTRSLSTFVLPASGPSADPWVVSRGPEPPEPASIRARVTGAVSSSPPNRLVVQATAIGALFLALLLMNLHTRRFFCNALCPLGALYGLVARFSLLRVRPGSDCTECGACAEACPSREGPAGDEGPQECLVCLHCLGDCPVGAVGLRRAEAAAPTRVPLDLGRRQLLASASAGLGISAIARLAPEGQSTSRRFLRPPGSLAETEFLSRCVRCGQCAEVCPTRFIQPAGLQTGPDGLWTPTVEAAIGYCAWSCNLCTQACPTGAIQALPLPEKQAFKIGTAVVDRSRCYTWADAMSCTVCADRCPVPGNAIRLEEEAAWSFSGERVTVKQIHVASDRCTGCGICEHVCPRLDAPGITISCDDEQRENVFESIGRGARS